MLVSDQKKILFLHIPKTGGSSVVKNKQISESCSLKINGHTVLLGIKRFKDININLNEYKKVCIIRDPIERFISAFFYLSEYHGSHADWERFNKYIKTKDINKYINKILIEEEVILPDLSKQHFKFCKKLAPMVHFHPQARWVVDGENKINIDYICNTKNMSESIPKIFKIPHSQFFKENVNKNKPQVKISEENILKLKKIYEVDYNFFGFDKERNFKEQSEYTSRRNNLN